VKNTDFFYLLSFNPFLAVSLAFMKPVAEILCYIPMSEVSGFKYERKVARINIRKQSGSFDL